MRKFLYLLSFVLLVSGLKAANGNTNRVGIFDNLYIPMASKFWW